MAPKTLIDLPERGGGVGAKTVVRSAGWVPMRASKRGWRRRLGMCLKGRPVCPQEAKP